MADEKLEHAQKVYETLCTTLDSLEWKYQKNEENLRIDCGAQGEDLPMEISIRVDADRQLIILLSHLPFVVSEEKRLEVAIATSVANNGLVDGSFDFDVTDGHMFFRMTSSFIESEIGNELFTYMIMVSCHTIDDYNDRFLMLAKGMMTIQDFMAKENN